VQPEQPRPRVVERSRCAKNATKEAHGRPPCRKQATSTVVHDYN